jgi:hypothetical protein
MMISLWKPFLAGALTCSLLMTCTGIASDNGGNCAVAVFLKMPFEQQKKEILHCSPSRQVDLYMRVVENTHPPEISLADSIAPTGHDLVPALLEELKYRTPLASQVGSLLFVFVRMKHLGYYDAASDPKLIRDIEERVKLIGEPESRGAAEELLESLRPADQ